MNVLTKEFREDLMECPFCNNNADVCAASLLSLKLGKLLRFNHCNSENYDDCAIFLARSLRSRW